MQSNVTGYPKSWVMKNKLAFSLLAFFMVLAFVPPLQAAAEMSGRGPNTVRGFNFSAEKLGEEGVGRVCVADSGRVACLDGKTGKVLWSEKSPVRGTYAVLDAGPVIAGSRLVFVGSKYAKTYGLNLRTGKVEWTYQNSLNVHKIGAGSHTIFLPDGPALGLLALDAQTGKLKWRHELVKVGGGWLGQLVYAEGRLYTDSPYIWNAGTGQLVRQLAFSPEVVSSACGRVYLLGNGIPLIAIDAATSKMLWKDSRVAHADTIHVSASQHYVAVAMLTNGNGTLAVYAASSGRRLWSRPIADAADVQDVSVTAGKRFIYVVILRVHKGTKLLQYSAQDGKRQWTKTYAMTGPIIIGPVVTVGSIVLVSTGVSGTWRHGGVEAIDRNTGSSLWKFAF